MVRCVFRALVTSRPSRACLCLCAAMLNARGFGGSGGLASLSMTPRRLMGSIAGTPTPMSRVSRMNAAGGAGSDARVAELESLLMDALWRTERAESDVETAKSQVDLSVQKSEKFERSILVRGTRPAVHLAFMSRS